MKRFLRPFLLALMAASVCAAASMGLRAQFFSEPEFMSVNSKRGNVRAEPDLDAEVLWRMWKLMPVEIIAYRGDWRRVRDLDGDTGWMHKDILSEIPTVMVATKQARLRKSPGGKVEWILERGYPLRVFSRRKDWLEVSDLATVSGWIHASVVWGAKAPEPD